MTSHALISSVLGSLSVRHQRGYIRYAPEISIVEFTSIFPEPKTILVKIWKSCISSRFHGSAGGWCPSVHLPLSLPPVCFPFSRWCRGKPEGKGAWEPFSGQKNICFLWEVMVDSLCYARCGVWWLLHCLLQRGGGTVVVLQVLFLFSWCPRIFQ